MTNNKKKQKKSTYSSDIENCKQNINSFGNFFSTFQITYEASRNSSVTTRKMNKFLFKQKLTIFKQ